MRTKLTFAALALALFAAPAYAANSLGVTNAAALNGTSFGLQVNVDGSNNDVFVSDFSPSGEDTYTYTFWIHPGNLDLDQDTALRIIAVGDENAAIGQHILHFLRRDYACNPPNGCWILNTWTRQDTGGYQFFTSGIFISFYEPQFRVPTQFRVEFSAGTGNNGVLRITRLTGTQVVREVTTRDTDTINVDNIRIGALAGSGVNGNSGAYYFDEFVSTR